MSYKFLSFKFITSEPSLLPLSLRLSIRYSHLIEFEIASIKLFDIIVLPILFRCYLDPYMCVLICLSLPEKYPNTAFFLYFPAVSLRIQPECEKIRTRKNSVFGHFSRSVNACVLMIYYLEVSFLT